MARLVHLAVASLCLLLSACANQNSIYRNERVFSVDRPTVITSDAKQRHLLAAPIRTYDKDGKAVYTEGWRLCAEASPDVFSALSTSASGELSISKGAPEQRVRGALAIAEAAATIERTQTINLFRESMYRTCERYLSGAIGGAELSVQAARDQRAMVAVLAIEQLTRSVWPQTTVINAGQASASLRDNTAYLEARQAAAKEDVKAKADLKDKTEKQAALKVTCDAVPAVAEGEDDSITAKREACAEDTAKAKAAYDQAKSEADQAAAALKELQGMQPGDNSVSFTAAAGQGATTVKANVVTDRSNSNDVAVAVTKIVEKSLAFDEVQMLCVRILIPTDRVSDPVPDDKLRSSCMALISQKANLDATKVMLEQQQTEQILRGFRAEVDQRVLTLRAAVDKIPNDQVRAWWSGILDKAKLPVVSTAAYRDVSTREDVVTQFRRLIADHQTLVISALN